VILYGGERVSLERGYPSLTSMGASLGRIARFNGHTELYYTVLAHSFTVAALMPPEWGINGLMHDTQEILFADVPTPMKTQIARNREMVVQERIYKGYGIPLMTEEQVAAVELADHKALVAEANVLKHSGCIAQWGNEYDEEAGRLTRKYLKKVIAWTNPEKSIPEFKKQFDKYMKLAGIEPEGWE
jgi:5'-deoxynucleotidase YfbR-like HD superfamily hydrolase